MKNLNERVSQYWTDHNVTMHHHFLSRKDSLEYMHWRNDQYFNLKESMPVCGFDGKAVLDYGCGPGNDIIGFGEFSKCSRLVGVDVSSSSISELRNRLKFHAFSADIVLINADSSELPFDDKSFDHIHCAGVLHHMSDPTRVLREFKRILKQEGSINVMVYNYYSLWVHLYVAYHLAITQSFHPEAELLDQFRMSTDGIDCPISNCYKSHEWIEICKDAGLEATFTGAGVSMHEMTLLSSRYDAIQDRRLPRESREFLYALQFCPMGYPMYNGHYAGIDGFYTLRKSK